MEAKKNVLLFLYLLVPYLSLCQIDTNLISITGGTQGTTYHIKYRDTQNRVFRKEIERLLLDIDLCVSNYRDDSELALFNKSHSVLFQRRHFLPLLQKSKQVFKATNGAFDPTIYPLVKAYGFGPNRHRTPIENIDSLLALVNFNHISFDSISVAKAKEHVELDFNAIAKGYTVDQIALLLEQNQIEHYLVEIGGELRCKGEKQPSQPWTIGIEDPDNPRQFRRVMVIRDKGMATSGNYRNRYKYQQEIINHILNPKTGSYQASDIVSVTVVTDEAAFADAYATAFMVMGFEATKRFLEYHPEIDAYIIYRDSTQNIREFATEAAYDKH